MCSGEELGRELRDRFRAVAGQTETGESLWLYRSGCGSTLHEVNDEFETERVPIGKAITNTTVYIFNSSMEVAPIGVAGELYVGGEGLARGFLRDQTLRQRGLYRIHIAKNRGRGFIGQGTYADGPKDGSIEFIGRADDQVKERGYRIELGEVEAVLKKEGRVREAAVVLRAEGESYKALIGYVVAAEGERISGSELRSYLKGKLPEHMVPARVMVLEKYSTYT